MSKLHEVIAVEGHLKTAYNKAVNIFKDVINYEHGMLGKQIKYNMNEGAKPRYDEIHLPEHNAEEELKTLFNSFASFTNVSLTKEIGNQKAEADVIIDGIKILENVPAPALLNLENKLKSLLEIIENIDYTLDRSVTWNNHGKGYYEADPTYSSTTEKLQQHVIVVEATEHHPAQYELVTNDVNTGTREITLFSGMISLETKNKILDRLNNLYVAVVKARQQANTTEITDYSYGTEVVNYLLDY